MEKKNTTDIEDPLKFYEAIVNFEKSEEAQDYYYKVMDTETGKVKPDGHNETIRDLILKTYVILFCEDAPAGKLADTDDVADTADRLYLGSIGFGPDRWYRMKYHFPVIDDDNYDRFAALVLADMKAGPLHDAALNDGDTLVVGEANPLQMTMEERKNQKAVSVSIPGGHEE